jgi:hypothetical protein
MATTLSMGSWGADPYEHMHENFPLVLNNVRVPLVAERKQRQGALGSGAAPSAARCGHCSDRCSNVAAERRVGGSQWRVPWARIRIR